MSVYTIGEDSTFWFTFSSLKKIDLDWSYLIYICCSIYHNLLHYFIKKNKNKNCQQLSYFHVYVKWKFVCNACVTLNLVVGNRLISIENAKIDCEITILKSIWGARFQNQFYNFIFFMLDK